MFLYFISAELISRKEFFSHPQYSLPKVSPNGKKLAYIAPYKGILNIWMGKNRISKIREAGLSNFYWAADSKTIFYLKDKDCDFKFHLYAIDLDKNKAKDLTPYKNVMMRVLHISAQYPRKVAVGINKRNPKYHDIYLLDLDTGEVKLIYENQDGYLRFFIDDNFNIKAKVKYLTDGAAVVYDGQGQKLLAFNSDDSFNTDFLEFDFKNDVFYFLIEKVILISALYPYNSSFPEKVISP